MLDRVSVLSRIAVDIFDGHNGEGQSSHVPVFCVNLELWGIIIFTFKTPCYVYYSCSGGGPVHPRVPIHAHP